MNGFRLDDNFEPVSKLHTLDDLWQLVVAIELAPGFLGGIDQLEDQGKRRLVGEAAFARIVLWRTVAKVLSMGFVVRKCFQCSAGKS